MTATSPASSFENHSDEFIARRIAHHLRSAPGFMRPLNELIDRVTADLVESGDHSPNAGTISWTVLQIKNEMIKRGMLFTSFTRPLQQNVVLTMKGKARYKE